MDFTVGIHVRDSMESVFLFSMVPGLDISKGGIRGTSASTRKLSSMSP